MIEKKKKNSSSVGFSLIELSIVILITGLLFIPLVRGFSLYQKNAQLTEEKESVSLASGLIGLYKGGLSAYPCPADASLPPTDAQYGMPQCASTSLLNANAALVNVGDCTAGGGVCLIASANPLLPAKRVLVGMVPHTFITGLIGNVIPYADEDLIDPWGNRIMYAVSEDLTASNTYLYYEGVIAAVDEWGNPTAGIDNDAHYAVFSHGRDRRGGFNALGDQNFACGTALNSRDFENCNGDAIFVQAKGAYLETAGATYYDDSIFFGKEISQSIWKYESDMVNVKTTILGNVGIGTSAPGTKLDVQNGAGTAELSIDNSVLTKNICNASGTECFDVNRITGTGFIRCGTSGDVMVGISNTNEDCATPVFAAPTASQACGVGQWLHGLKTNGDIICYP